MNAPIRSASGHLPVFPRLISEYLSDEGFQEREVFAGLGFSKADLTREEFRLSTKQHENFIKRAVQLTGDPHLALSIKDRATDVTTSAVLLLFASSGRISRGLRLIAHYNHVFTRTLTARLEEHDGAPVIAFECHLDDADVSYFAISSFMLFIDNFFRDALAGRHLATRAELAIPEPDGFAEVADRFGFALAFDCERTCLYLDPDLIDEPLRYADPQTTRLITEVCEKQLRELNAETSTHGAVKALVAEHITAPPSLDQAAAALGLSSRSLRRSLQQSGTTYLGILGETRREIATKLLRETDESVASIAYQIGFEHPSHFGRAFKGWTGKSPSQFRDNH